MISSIEDELSACEEFFISVAFITMSGITPLLQTLKELEQKGIPGKILTTDYLMFSDPKALQKLAGFQNLSLKMFMTQNMHEISKSTPKEPGNFQDLQLRRTAFQ